MLKLKKLSRSKICGHSFVGKNTVKPYDLTIMEIY